MFSINSLWTKLFVDELCNYSIIKNPGNIKGCAARLFIVRAELGRLTKKLLSGNNVC